MDDREQAVAAQQRMANFRLRSSLSSSTITNSAAFNVPAKCHARSHSGNSTTDFAFSSSSTTCSFSSEESQEHAVSVPSSPSPRSRPNSHHRRRSSVSTRRESAEMMGVAPPPELGPDAVDDQSELRRLALWALEGKSRSDNALIGGFTKVEIPELNTLDTNASSNAIQALKSKPTLSPFGMSGALAGKRDSFGKLLISASNSLKDQLHTLMEEEEEEEEAEDKKDVVNITEEQEETVTPPANFRGESSFPRPTISPPCRPRPANLTLRPLSLTPESLPLSGSDGLPTPSPTPSPRIVGLKALKLAPSPSPSPAPLNHSVSSISSRRQSLSARSSPSSMEYLQRRQSIGSFASPTCSAIKRKSSISYKRSDSIDHPSASLPTPSPTPTSPLPPLHVALPSPSSSGVTGLVPDLDRPLSPTEQAFLFRSHTSLLCRISDLERAVAGGRLGQSPDSKSEVPTRASLRLDDGYNPLKSHERPISFTSMSTTYDPESLPPQPSDEMLQLVSDLKSERDELMRDADGWRTRVADLEKQIGTLTRRVEAERQDAWVLRERLGLMEVEKKGIKEDLEHCRLECRKFEKALRSEEGARTKTEEEVGVMSNLLKAERKGRHMAEREVETLRVELDQLCTRAEQADADLQALLATPKVELTMQMPVPRRFSSVDSQLSASSITDVEEYFPVGIRTFKLNAVEEEVESRDIPRDVTNDSGSENDNDELAHYEDDGELDDDMMFGEDQTSSSFGSIVHSNSHLLRLDLATVAPSPTPVPALPSHAKSGSMERGWSFPQGHDKSSSAPTRDPPKIDHFFECLDALDASETADEPGSLPTYDSTTAKQFWRGAVQTVDEDNDLPPFVLPTQPRKEKDWKEIEAAKLEVVAEEAEEDFSFKYPTFPPQPEMRPTFDTENDPLTPRAGVYQKLQVHVDTLKHAKARRTSVDLAIPGFRPYSGSVPVLKPPPLPKQVGSPAKDSPALPTGKGDVAVAFKPTSPTLIPQPTYKSQPTVLTTPPKPRPSNAGSTFIPRLSTSPNALLARTMPATCTPTKNREHSISAAHVSTPSKASTVSMPPVFIPQPKTTSKSVTRSSILPPKPPMLTRLPIAQQTATPVVSSLKQGLTSKLSQQMQSLTSLWSPWSPSPDTSAKALAGSRFDTMYRQYPVTKYVSRERQLDRLRRDIRADIALMACGACANCRDGVIFI